MMPEANTFNRAFVRLLAGALILAPGIAEAPLTAQSSSIPSGLAVQVKADRSGRGVPSRIEVRNVNYPRSSVTTLDNGFWEFAGLQCTTNLKFTVTPNDLRAYQPREYQPGCGPRPRGLIVITVQPNRS